MVNAVTRKRIFSEVRDYLILLMLGFLMTWTKVACDGCWSTTRELLVVSSFTAALWIALWKGNEYLGEFISTKISWLQYPVKRFLVGTAATIAYTLASMYLITAIYKQTFLLSLPAGVMASVVITIVISLFMHGRSFLLNWRNAAVSLEKLQKESVAAKYEALKSQINPHFLFNSLNALTNLIYEDEAKAIRFIEQLEEVYHYVLESRGKELVPLSEELRFLDAYLYLQQIRFGAKLHIANEVRETETLIAPLALQMLIENAIKHNIISQDDPLFISMKVEGDYLIVANSLQKKRFVAEESSGVGLENIKKRYEVISDKEVQVIRHSETFAVKLPLISSVKLQS